MQCIWQGIRPQTTINDNSWPSQQIYLVTTTQKWIQQFLICLLVSTAFYVLRGFIFTIHPQRAYQHEQRVARNACELSRSGMRFERFGAFAYYLLFQKFFRMDLLVLLLITCNFSSGCHRVEFCIHFWWHKWCGFYYIDAKANPFLSRNVPISCPIIKCNLFLIAGNWSSR